MAEAWLRHLTQESVRKEIQVFSAGSSPLGVVPEETVAVMKEVGIDIVEQWSKSIDDLPQKKFDYVISLCGDRCPFVPTNQHINWPIPDPIGQPLESYRATRDLLKAKLETFLKEILHQDS